MADETRTGQSRTMAPEAEQAASRSGLRTPFLAGLALGFGLVVASAFLLRVGPRTPQEPDSGRVHIQVEPPSAQIELRNEGSGETLAISLTDGGFEGALPVGAYVARASAAGHHDGEAAFLVTPDDAALVPISLRPVAEVHHTRETRVVPPVVVPAPAPFYAPRPRIHRPGYYRPAPRLPRPPRPYGPRPFRPRFR